MATTTPRLGLSQPTVGADDGLWGDMWNGNATILDALMRPADVAASYLPLAGGVMLGALTLHSVAPTDSYHAAPKVYVDTGLAQKIGDAPADSQYWVRRNNAWALSPGGMTDAPSDGKAWSRQNALWVSNPFYDAKGNLGVSIAPPTAQAAPNAQGGWTFGWGLTANNWAYNGYYDGTTWRYLAAGNFWQQSMAGNIEWQYAPTGAKDAAAAPGTKMTLDGLGNLTTNGIVQALGGGVQIKAPSDARWSLYSTNAPADQKIVDAYISPTGTFGMQFVNDAFNAGNAFFSVARSGFAIESLSLTAPQIYMNGSVNVTGNLSANGTIYPSATATNYAYSLFSSGNYRYIKFTVDSWLLRFDAATGNLDYFNPGGASLFQISGGGNVWANNNLSVNIGVNYRAYGSNYMGFGWDGNISAVNAYVDNTWVGRVALHNQDITGARIRATNSFMNSTGAFYVADNEAYYLARNSPDGTWQFVENGQWNFHVQANGDTRTRNTNYALYHFATTLYFCNSWDCWIGPSGYQRIMQYGPGWYWNWNTQTGEHHWLAVDHELWRMRASDNLVWNPSGPVGGNGPYANISDRRMKESICEASVGLREVLQLKPVRFQRRRFGAEVQKRPDGTTFVQAPSPPELGFLADEVRSVMPDAVRVVGSPTPDGDGGLDSDDPTLALTYDSITVALVAAFQEMHAELQALKKGRRT